MNFQKTIHVASQWESYSKIDEGGFGNVVKTKKKENFIKFDWEKDYVAIKIIPIHKFNENEIDISSKINHPNVVKFYGYGNDETHYYIYMEVVDGESVEFRLLVEKKFSDDVILWITHQVLLALEYCHNNKIIHRDIKPGNILLDYKNHRVKLIDFGLSKEFIENSTHCSNVGTNGYRAPEIIDQNNKARRKSDIWSLACTIIVMAGGRLGQTADNIIQNIPDSLPHYIKYILFKCLLQDTDKRYDVQNLLDCSHIKKYSDLNIIVYSATQQLKIFHLENGKLLKKIPTPNLDQHFLEPNKSFGITNNCLSLKIDDHFNKIGPNFIPDNVKILKFGQYFNKPLEYIPNGITSLHLGEYFDKPLMKNSIPNSVTELVFGYDFNQKLNPESIPHSVLTLVFGDLFNQKLEPGDIPSGVTSLSFGFSFNQTLNQNDIPGNIIPHGVKELKFGFSFNKKLYPGDLPCSIHSLTFGDSFDQVLDVFVIPQGTKYLKLGSSFSKTLIEGSIPNTVSTLVLGYSFNQINKSFIPKSVSKLVFGELFNEKLEPGSIPIGVTSLSFGKYFNQQLAPNDIPNSVTSLSFGKCFNQPLGPDVIPTSIKYLFFGKNFNQDIVPNVPKGVILKFDTSTLKLDNYFDKPLISDDITKNITDLEFGNHFNKSIKSGNIPSSVVSLRFGDDYNKPLSPGGIPHSVVSLSFGHHFNQPINPGDIPNSVISLAFGYRFNQTLNPKSIPENVKTISFGFSFTKELPNHMPKSLTSISLSSYPTTLNIFKKISINLMYIPPTIERFEFNGKLTESFTSSFFIKLPLITHLTILNYNFPIDKNVFPTSLTHLTLGKSFEIENRLNLSLANLPPTIDLVINCSQYIYIKNLKTYIKEEN